MSDSQNKNKKDGFTSRFGVIAATAGSAVGLGNIWAFSYKTGVNGGGLFILIYLVFVAFIGFPIMISEFIIGRHGKGSPIEACTNIDKEVGNKSNFLSYGGIIGAITLMLVLSFYSVIAGWSMHYLKVGILEGFSAYTSETSPNLFGGFITSSVTPVVYQMIFLVLTMLIVLMGVEKGIEKISKILMPMLFVIIIFLVIHGMFSSGFSQAVDFLFKPKFADASQNFWKITNIALGHAFFSLSLGMYGIVTYGIYVNEKEDLKTISIQTTIADTLVAILSGLAIFPIVFSAGIDPGSGPGLAFVSLPIAFATMAGGRIIGSIFFFLLLAAAITSSISMLETPVLAVSEAFKLKRIHAVLIVGTICAVIGVACQIGMGVRIGFLDVFFSSSELEGGNILLLDQLDRLTNTLTIPLGALIIVLFCGWRTNKDIISKEFGDNKFTTFFTNYIKYFVPIVILWVLIAPWLKILFPNTFGFIQFA